MGKFQYSTYYMEPGCFEDYQIASSALNQIKEKVLDEHYYNTDMHKVAQGTKVQRDIDIADLHRFDKTFKTTSAGVLQQIINLRSGVDDYQMMELIKILSGLEMYNEDYYDFMIKYTKEVNSGEQNPRNTIPRHKGIAAYMGYYKPGLKDTEKVLRSVNKVFNFLDTQLDIALG